MKKTATILFALFVAITSLARQIGVEVPKVVAVGEYVPITFTISERASKFEWAPGDNFDLLWGPQTGSSTSISIVNGKTTRSESHTYSYMLSARSKGTFTLPAARAVIGGKEILSKAVTIEVVGNQSSGNAARPQQHSDAVEREAGASSEEMFLHLSLSRTNVVVGEPISVTLKLYTLANISGFEDAKFPSFNGFWAQETEQPRNVAFERESLNDRIYNAAVLRKWVIIPQKTGSVSIEPAELVCLQQQRVSSGNSIFDGFFDDFRTVRRRLTSKSRIVNVSALPAGAPASFTGAVGSYRISASLDRDTLKVHDAAALSVTVTGRGNVALVGAPKVKFPPDSEIYDTKTADRLDSGSGGTSGSKTFEYPFIPRSHGDFAIAPVEFTYYDIKARKYVTLSTPELRYSVSPSEDGAASYVSPDGVVIPQTVHRDVKNLGEDIHFITTKMPSLSSKGSFFAGTVLFWSFMGGIFALFLLVWLSVRKTRSARADIVAVRTRGASKAARKRLVAAKGYLEQGLYSAFYEELHKALLGYASDKLSLGAADLSKDAISDAFLAAGAKDGDVAEFTSLVDECEFARYSPSGGNDAMKDSYEKAMDVISALESIVRRGGGGSLAAVAALIMCLSSFPLSARQLSCVDSLWQAGVQAFSAEDFSSARKAFAGIEAMGMVSPELYTNIADCCYKDRSLGEAILYYERALKMDPSCKDARFNIGIARGLCQDRIETVPEFFLKTWCRDICFCFPSDVWAWAAVGVAALLAAFALMFLLGRSASSRRVGFFAGIVSIVLLAVCAGNAFWQKAQSLREDRAVVMVPVCSVKSAPSASSGADLFILHEGTLLHVLDTVGEWTNVSIADGREGWLPSADVKII